MAGIALDDADDDTEDAEGRRKNLDDEDLDEEGRVLGVYAGQEEGLVM
jgi:hypothetical protein